MQDLKKPALAAVPTNSESIAGELLPDLERLAVLLQAIEALASGAAALSEEGPLDQIEALASLMGSRVEDMRSRLEGVP
ncbi:hypothetical protein ETW23_03825 [Leisingera sp. NJS201]|uniref:hypothetical protein n=1 Tax=Leisingera sp. NJS201 TaxID=2508306 RepID=UPI00107142D2|nr:hypothetical protein [Leisingera sp. NJS201]QBR35395.1 hypothetical protein ETW23_03825 [Leisingera sp. NJS201]